MAPRDYGYLVGLSSLWGSSYLFIKIALEGHVAPAEIVLGRLLTATAVLYLVARDPHWLFSYWDVDWSRFTGAIMRGGG